MTEYVVKVGKKGELYTPKKLRLKTGLDPGSELVAIIKGLDILLRKRKTLISVLEEDAIASVSEKEIKKERKILEEELLER